MQDEQLKQIAQRQPFRPWGVRLSTGALYVFNEPRDFGVTRNWRTIAHFGGNAAVLIDVDNIVELFDPKPNGA